MNGYIKIVLLDDTGKITNSSLCTTEGNLLFNEEKLQEPPILVQEILQLVKSNSQQKILI